MENVQANATTANTGWHPGLMFRSVESYSCETETFGRSERAPFPAVPFPVNTGAIVLGDPARQAQGIDNEQIHDAHSPWIGVDLDGTLAADTAGELWDAAGVPKIGRPVPEMVARIKEWVAAGQTVKIFTARASSPIQVKAIRKWLQQRDLPDLEVTNAKDLNMVELWDDRCVQVIPNSGRPVNPEVSRRLRVAAAAKGAKGSKTRLKFLFSLKQVLLTL